MIILLERRVAIKINNNRNNDKKLLIIMMIIISFDTICEMM